MRSPDPTHHRRCRTLRHAPVGCQGTACGLGLGGALQVGKRHSSLTAKDRSSTLVAKNERSSVAHSLLSSFRNWWRRRCWWRRTRLTSHDRYPPVHRLAAGPKSARRVPLWRKNLRLVRPGKTKVPLNERAFLRKRSAIKVASGPEVRSGCRTDPRPLPRGCPNRGASHRHPW